MSDGQIVEVGSGRLQGARAGEAIAFRGVPYATAQRFAAPGAVPGWSGVREAVRAGPAAPQPAREVATFTHGELPASNEALCLNLNVFTPSPAGSRPVLVWIHGGGFAIGHAGASIYEGSGLACSADAVIVTINYRLGSLGWLAHPALGGSPGAPAGNWGLQDQTAALEWVRQNISSFGGDPTQVTVAGQSAGALCAIDLLVSPRAKGLFKRAVLESPPLVDLAQPPEAGQRWAEALSAAAGGVGDFDLATLRSLRAEQLIAAHEELLGTPEFLGTRGGALPTVDPATVPSSPAASPGASPDVDLLIGTTAAEGTFFFNSPWRPAPGVERIPAIVGHLCHTEEPQLVIARYREAASDAGRPTDERSLLVEIATDAMFTDPVARWATARAAAVGQGQGHVHRYRVDHPGAGRTLGATHTVEVPLLFGTWRDGGPGARLGGQGTGTEEVARELVKAWSGFIHGGSPGWNEVRSTAPAEVGVFGGTRPRSVESASTPLTQA